MANTALKVVGIGCGVFVLLGVVAVGAGAYWVKGKAEGMVEFAENVEQQNKELASLNEQYPFAAPPEGEPLQLEESRVKKYFAIRAELEPVLAKYEAEMKKFEKKKTGEQASFSEAMGAVGAVGSLMSDMRTEYIAQLKKHGMSPSEFSATTGAVLTSGFGSAEAAYEGDHAEVFKSNAKLLEGYKAQLESTKTIGLDALLATNDTP